MDRHRPSDPDPGDSSLLLWEYTDASRSPPDPNTPGFDWLSPAERERLCNALIAHRRNDAPGCSDLYGGGTNTHALATLYGVKRGSVLGITWITTEADTMAEKLHAARNTPQFELWNVLTEIGIPACIKVEWEPYYERLGIRIFIGRSAEALDLIPPFHEPASAGTIERTHQEAWGEFLGVPEPDNSWYLHEEGSLNEVTPLVEEVERTISPTEEFFAELTPYFPCPTNAGVQRAIKNGRQYAEAVYQFGGKPLLQELVARSRPNTTTGTGRFTDRTDRTVEVDDIVPQLRRPPAVDSDGEESPSVDFVRGLFSEEEPAVAVYE